jgi:hypothetical protein
MSFEAGLMSVMLDCLRTARVNVSNAVNHARPAVVLRDAPSGRRGRSRWLLSACLQRTRKGGHRGLHDWSAPSFTPEQSGPLDRRNRLPRVGTPGAPRGSAHDSVRQLRFFCRKSG